MQIVRRNVISHTKHNAVSYLLRPTIMNLTHKHNESSKRIIEKVEASDEPFEESNAATNPWKSGPGGGGGCACVIS